MSGLLEGTTYEFRVIAENKAGKSDPSPPSQKVMPHDLISGNAPRFTEPLRDVTSREGQRVTLKCAVKASPEADVVWKKGLVTLTSGRKYDVERRDDVIMLSIRDVTHEDSENYVIEASNQHGHVTGSARLRVQGLKNFCPPL